VIDPGSDIWNPGGDATTGVNNQSDFQTAVLQALLSEGIDITRLSPDQIQAVIQATWATPKLQDEFNLYENPADYGGDLANVNVTATEIQDAIKRELFDASPGGSSDMSLLQMGISLKELQRVPLTTAQADYVQGTGTTGPSAYLADLARQAGFPESEIPTAVAVAMAESGGNPNAYGDPQYGGSIGLWQINLPAHPDLAQQFNLDDPLQNAKAAYQVWVNAGGRWTPWTTYNTGAYRQYLGQQGPLVTPGVTPGTDLKTLYPVAALKFKNQYGREPSNQELMAMAGMTSAQIDEYLRNQNSHIPGLTMGGYTDLKSTADSQSMSMFGHGVTDGMIAELQEKGLTSPTAVKDWLLQMDIEGKMDSKTYEAIWHANQPHMQGVYNSPGFDPRIAAEQYALAHQQGVKIPHPETIVQQQGANAPGFRDTPPDSGGGGQSAFRQMHQGTD
jgi:hypothetical protein